MLCQTQFTFFRLKVPFATPRHIYYSRLGENAFSLNSEIYYFIFYYCFFLALYGNQNVAIYPELFNISRMDIVPEINIYIITRVDIFDYLSSGL